MDDLKDIVSKNIIYLRTNSKMTQLELGEAFLRKSLYCLSTGCE